MIFALSSFVWALFMLWVVLDSYGQSKNPYDNIDPVRFALVGVVAFALFYGLFTILGALASGLIWSLS